MSAGGIEYTFFFAYCPPNTPWDVSLARFDENVFNLEIEHAEGQIPTAVVEVKNPRMGLIGPGRLYWVWISFSWEACGPLPLFFGRLVGVPQETLNNTIKMQFIARAADYVYQKQQVARSLKVLPNYDPVFFDVAKRDDPDAILEGWSALYHVDRINNRVSASDILIGEDGTVTFATQDVFYDSIQYRLLQPPLVAVNVKADVQWQQQWRDQFYVGQWAFPTFGGDAFIGEWPKSGGTLGGGWSAGISWAGERDPNPFQTASIEKGQRAPHPKTISFTWQNTARSHQYGDTMSVSVSYTPKWGDAIFIKGWQQFGLLMPSAVDGWGDPAPVNRPAKIIQDWLCYLPFAVLFNGKQSLASLGLVYQADRKRSERVELTVTADVQPVLIDPLVIEDTEQITLKSGDLSLPLLDLLNWDSVAGQPVSLGQFIFPDNPLVPGQTSTQIAVQAGTAGTTIPTFSNIAGATTTDGSVVWASLGDTPPAEGAQDWVRFARVPLGTLLLPKPISGVADITSAQIPGSLNYPPTGTAVPRYGIFCQGQGGPGSKMYEVKEPGMLGGFGVQATFNNFTNPTGRYMYIAVQAGTTGEFHVTFNESPGSQTTDGSVTWQNIGEVSLPIGGWPGGTPAASYFPTDRGQQSLQHMFCRARAKLRKRARAAEITFDTRFEVAAQLSCRMNGKVSDINLPGTTASGKVISYKLSVNGDSGVVKGIVVLGCSIGKVVVA